MPVPGVHGGVARPAPEESGDLDAACRRHVLLARVDTLRLLFVTVPPEKIEAGIAALAGVLRRAAS
jgi:hypothetical protein